MATNRGYVDLGAGLTPRAAAAWLESGYRVQENFSLFARGELEYPYGGRPEGRAVLGGRWTF